MTTKPKRANPEMKLQRDIIAVLGGLGYTVMETGKSRSRVKCSKCGTSSFATGWQGNTPGLPDLYVHRRGMGHPIAIALELKAPNGKPSETQKWLADNFMTTIVRSVEESLTVLANFETAIGNRTQSDKVRKMLSGLIEMKGLTNESISVD